MDLVQKIKLNNSLWTHNLKIWFKIKGIKIRNKINKAKIRKQIRIEE